ncbi:MAG: LysR family transcriptional regulator [Microbacterium sp.]|uniref:LysR family transcriptional regulator n=1 Tax=Microbacterium sp. TaxID=51671 RepID=UPI0039E56457
MNLSGLDLNLMLALDALLREENVTRAAERLNLAQPTVSRSLARLRAHFDDELLIRIGNDMELSPLAVRLRPLVAEALDSAKHVFAAHLEFDPSTSQRRFAIATSDYGLGALGAQWSTMISRQAPNVRVAFRTLPPEELTPYEVRTRDIDGAIAPHGYFPDEMPHLDVLRDRWVIIADESNDSIGSRPTIRQLSDLAWVTPFEAAGIPPAQMQRNEWASIATRIAVVVDHFSEMPLCVRGTKRVALIQERLFRALDARHGLKVMSPPFAMDPIVLSFWWHPTHNTDREHRWMRAQFDYFREQALVRPAERARPAL